jgi:hypothetical protein
VNWKFEVGRSGDEKRKAKIERRSLLSLRLDAMFHFRISLFGFRFSKFLGCLAAGVLAFACPAAAYAQGCPLCYNTAAAAKASAIQALRSGIIILIVPPLLICAGILWRGIKARDMFNEPAAEIWEEEAGK